MYITKRHEVDMEETLKRMCNKSARCIIGYPELFKELGATTNYMREKVKLEISELQAEKKVIITIDKHDRRSRIIIVADQVKKASQDLHSNTKKSFLRKILLRITDIDKQIKQELERLMQ
jgi:hypothetical protein